MSHSRDDVIAAIRASFAEDRWSHVTQLLDAYGVESHERERERVQLAIVKLSMGSEEKLREHVAIAKLDYRDILLWADYPRESKIETPQKKKEALDPLKKFGFKPPAGPEE